MIKKFTFVFSNVKFKKKTCYYRDFLLKLLNCKLYDKITLIIIKRSHSIHRNNIFVFWNSTYIIYYNKYFIFVIIIIIFYLPHILL